MAIARRHLDIPPRLRARIAGVLYLIIFVAAPSGAAEATPVNMTINLACDIGVALLFYDLFEPVSRSISLLAALFRLIFVAVMAANALNYFGVLNLFDAAGSASAFNTGYGVALVPFGLHCLLTGRLIFKSTFLPGIIGILVMAAGSGYLIFLWPALGERLFVPYILVPALIGEGSLTLWLIVLGVNSARWAERAAASTQPGMSL
jgi:Domain of unknown function (DUF4386)